MKLREQKVTPLHLNHMPYTAPCIPWEHSCHNFNKSAYQIRCEKQKFRQANNLINDCTPTLHMVADGGRYTSQASPQLLWKSEISFQKPI